MKNSITNSRITDSDWLTEVESFRFAAEVHAEEQARNSDGEMDHAEEQARDYDEAMALIDQDIEYGLMRQFPWYRSD